MLYVQNPDLVTTRPGRRATHPRQVHRTSHRFEPTRPPLATFDARLLALVLLAVGIRLLYVGTQPDRSHLASTDAWGYHRLALNLDLGHGFSLDRQAPFEPDSVRTPLYPLLLLMARRLVGPTPRAAVLVQAMLDGVSTLLTYQLTRRLVAALGSTAGPRAGRAAALLYALNPAQVRQANDLLTETLLSCLLLLGLCLLLHYRRLRYASAIPNEPSRWALAVGVVAALAALCKPNVQFLPLLWTPAIRLGSRPPVPPVKPAREEQKAVHRWRDAVLVLLAYGAPLLLWIVRNQVVFGRPFLSAAFWGNISRVSAPAALLTARGQYALPWSAEWESAFGEIVTQAADRYRWDRPWELMDARARDRADRQVYQVARQVLARHPGAWAVSHLQGTLRYLEPQTYRVLYAHWTGHIWPPDVLDDALIHTVRALAYGGWDEAGRIVTQERWSRLTPLQQATWWGQFGAVLLTTALALRGAWALRRHPMLLLAVAGTIAYVLVLPGPIAYERFRVPVLGPILALAALPFASAGRLCYNRR